MSGEGILGVEPPDAGNLGDDLGRGEPADPRQPEQRRCEPRDLLDDPSLELVRGHGQLADPCHEVASHPGNGAPEPIQAGTERVQMLEAHERA